MTLWQDQLSRQNRSAVDPSSDGRPLSRREARERERQAAEALAAGRVHPSGVMDFDGHDLRDEIGSDQEYRVHDTADIWAALNRRSDLPGGGVDRLRGAEPSIPSAGVASAAELAARSGTATPGAGLPPVTDDLMDRVRGAVLGRERGQAAAYGAQQRPLTRRELRAQQAPEDVDALPASWFDETGRPARPAAAAPAAFTGATYPEYTDEPTVAMPALDRAALDAQAPVTAAVDLPRFFTEPVGDDALTFSAQMEAEVAEPLAAHPAAAAEAAFLEPRTEAPRYLEPEPPRFVEPRTETTDVPTSLAGFEALISRARGTGAPQPQPPAAVQPPQPQQQLRNIEQPAARPAPVWKDDQPDEPAGFSGLLSRSVGASSGSQNALILPHDPQPDFTQAISGSGDIFITGTHHLPRSVAERGASAHQVDSREMDRLYEAAHDEPASGVSPVRASSAVSGGMTGRSPIARRSHSAALPTILAIVAGLMAVGVIVMLVGSWVLRLF